MSVRRGYYFLYVIAFCLGMSFGANAEESVPLWRLNHESSHLYFVFKQLGSEERGEFRDFDASFRFAPERLEKSHFEVQIELQGLDTGEAERDDVLRSADMFDVEKWPVARFRATGISASDNDGYIADAELTIRDTTRTLKFPFQLELNKDKTRFRMQSELYINRLNYGVGQGDWATTTWIADEVKVIVDVVAERIP